MLKLTMRKENLMKVMESISKENNEWEGLIQRAYIGSVDIWNRGESSPIGESVELNLQCPEYIRNKFRYMTHVIPLSQIR